MIRVVVLIHVAVAGTFLARVAPRSKNDNVCYHDWGMSIQNQRDTYVSRHSTTGRRELA